ncbi:MAG: hypothetical protein ABL921_18995 [Pirellula sp.]
MNMHACRLILRPIVLICLFFVPCAAECIAQSKAQLVSELMEFMGRRFGKEIAEEGSEVLSRKVESFLLRYGDDGAEALRKVGPRSIQLLDNAATEGAQSARLLAKYGDEAVWVVGDQGRRKLVAQLGDDAAEAMIKHGEIAEPVLHSAGKSAATAMRTVSSQNARRIAMMAKDGELEKLGRSTELMEVVGKYGDKAMDFVWKNKGTLMLGTAMAAFLADPEPFLNGTRELADIAAKTAIEPIAKEIGSHTNWTMTIIALSFCLMLYMVIKSWMKRSKLR